MMNFLRWVFTGPYHDTAKADFAAILFTFAILLVFSGSALIGLILGKLLGFLSVTLIIFLGLVIAAVAVGMKAYKDYKNER